MHSASCAMNEITNAIHTKGFRNRNQSVIQPPCCSTIVDIRIDPASTMIVRNEIASGIS